MRAPALIHLGAMIATAPVASTAKTAKMACINYLACVALSCTRGVSLTIVAGSHHDRSYR